MAPAPPVCEDNDIPGFGSFWCELNTDQKYVTGSDKEGFCNDRGLPAGQRDWRLCTFFAYRWLARVSKVCR